MLHEIDHIEEDRPALSWAFGCVLASYSERVGAMDVFRSIIARSVLAAMIAFEALRAFFAPIMALSYRLRDTGLAERLGGFTPGDDYRRFIPLMDATPLWLLCFGIGSGVIFLVAAWKLLRGGSRSAFIFFALGLGLNLLGFVSGTFVPGYAEANRQAFTFIQPNFRRDVLIPAAGVLLPVFIAGALWWIARLKLLSQSDHQTS